MEKPAVMNHAWRTLLGSRLAHAALIALAAIAVYLIAIDAPLIADDTVYITQNPAITGWQSFMDAASGALHFEHWNLRAHFQNRIPRRALDL